MVKYFATLDSTFGALADPTRRAILASLTLGEASSRTSQASSHVLPAVMKHVRVLQNAGLVSQKKIGRTRFCGSRQLPSGKPKTGSPSTAASGKALSIP